MTTSVDKDPAPDPQTVAHSCAKQGFAAIGITVKNDDQVIDFSLIGGEMAAALANSIEVCVDGQGFSVPALSGTFQILSSQGTLMPFGNFVAELVKLMTPKVED